MSPWEDQQGQWILGHAWFMRLVERLCDLAPLLWHYLQGSYSTNPLHATGGTRRPRGWLRLQVLLTRWLGKESIHHGPTTVSSCICLLPGIFWVSGNVGVPRLAPSPGEIILDQCHINSWRTSATSLIHGGMSAVKTTGFGFKIPKWTLLLVLEQAARRWLQVHQVL